MSEIQKVLIFLDIKRHFAYIPKTFQDMLVKEIYEEFQLGILINPTAIKPTNLIVTIMNGP